MLKIRSKNIQTSLKSSINENHEITGYFKSNHQVYVKLCKFTIDEFQSEYEKNVKIDVYLELENLFFFNKRYKNMIFKIMY